MTRLEFSSRFVTPFCFANSTIWLILSPAAPACFKAWKAMALSVPGFSLASSSCVQYPAVIVQVYVEHIHQLSLHIPVHSGVVTLS